MFSLRRSAVGLLIAAAALSGCGKIATGTAVTSAGSPTAGSPTAGSSPFGTSAFGTSAFGTSGFGTSAAGTSAAATTPASSADGSAPPSPGASPETTLPTSPPDSTTPVATPILTSGPTRLPGARLTLTGIVRAGVEARCLLLEDESTGLQVNITGGDETVVEVGRRVTVVGQVRPDLMSYCQQGAVFQVSSAKAAAG